MGQQNTKYTELINKMEGSDFGLVKEVSSIGQRVNKNGMINIDKTIEYANHPMFSSREYEEALNGLMFEFNKIQVDIGRNEMHQRKQTFITIRCHGGVLPEGPTRVTTTRGFLFLYLSVHEIFTALGILKEASLEMQHRIKAASGGTEAGASTNNQREECPICMDRHIDTVLSCGHGLCKVCEIEWLVGEGRGTCPICRTKETEGDDWVLNDSVGASVDRMEVHERVSLVLLMVLRFLSGLPTWDQFASSLDLPKDESECSVYDGLGNWIKGQIAYLQDIKHESNWARCSRCTTIIRVPPTSVKDTRLTCTGCRTLWVVGQLEPV
jgi:hypothetical protein